VPEFEISAWLFAPYHPFQKVDRSLDYALGAFPIGSGLAWFPVLVVIVRSALPAALVAHLVSSFKAAAVASPFTFSYA
jgi:hypothetical protein